MGQISLYRKYRPKTFSQVIGQNHVVRALKKAISEDRLHHAYLFSGPRGTGKTSTARIIARSLNCEKGPTAEPCNKCSACKEIAEGTSIDVVEIDAASHGSVEDARDLREKIAFAPVQGHRKVYIYDECHMLTPAANNALLKLLEEPPGHVIFVFVTTEPHKMLQTLVDRCQRYQFRALSSTDIATGLTAVAEEEGINVGDEVTGMIASRASGSMRDALGLLEQVSALAGENVTPEDITSVLGTIPDDLMFEAVDIISERDPGGALVFGDRMIRSGRDVREFGRALVDHLRSLFLVLHAPAAQEILAVSDDHLERLRAQANHLSAPELLRLLDLAGEMNLSLKQAAEPRVVLEVALARMSNPSLQATGASLLSRLERIERMVGLETDSAPATAEPAPKPVPKSPSTKPKGAAAPTAKARPSKQQEKTPAKKPKAAAAAGRSATMQTPTPEIAPAELDIEKIKRAWDIVLGKVKQRKISFQALLLAAAPTDYENNELTLTFGPRHRYHRDQVDNPVTQQPLVEAIFETFGVRPKVTCLVSEDELKASFPEEPPTQVTSEAGSADPVDAIKGVFGGADVVEEKKK